MSGRGIFGHKTVLSYFLHINSLKVFLFYRENKKVAGDEEALASCGQTNLCDNSPYYDSRYDPSSIFLSCFLIVHFIWRFYSPNFGGETLSCCQSSYFCPLSDFCINCSLDSYDHTTVEVSRSNMYVGM